MANYYNELCVGIPSGIVITGCSIDSRWTTVEIDGSIGVARTVGQVSAETDAVAKAFVGIHLRDAATYLKWKNSIDASVGMAAMNAFYNSPAHIETLECAGKAPFCDAMKGQPVTVIGDITPWEHWLLENCTVKTLPLPAGKELDADCVAALAKGWVVVSGDAMTGEMLATMLANTTKETKMILCGASVPAAHILFAYGSPVVQLNGFYVPDAKMNVEGESWDVRCSTYSLNPVKVKYFHES